MCEISAVERSKADVSENRRLIGTTYKDILEVRQLGICLETTAEITVRTGLNIIEEGEKKKKIGRYGGIDRFVIHGSAVKNSFYISRFLYAVQQFTF